MFTSISSARIGTFVCQVFGALEEAIDNAEAASWSARKQVW